jgi:hypothetical protein
MNRYSVSSLLLAVFGLLPSAQAGELGRLFYTPQQRQQLEFQDTTSSPENAGRTNYIIVNGVVQKHGGNRTVWINGAAQASEHGNDRTPATVPVIVPGKQRPVQLKVGQRLMLDSTPAEETPAPDTNK